MVVNHLKCIWRLADMEVGCEPQANIWICWENRYRNNAGTKIMPAVIVAITNGDKILLSKYEGRGLKQYALIAGFAEIGETIEETVYREVMEEVGLKVKNLRYYKSQPWSFSGTLLFEFFCDVDGDDTLTVDHKELSIAQWFERDKIIGQDTNSSLTNEMMMAFASGKEPKESEEAK